MRKTIGKKINHLLSGSLIILAFSMMTINLIQVYKNTNETSQVMLSKSCENQAAALNNQINLIEQSVDNIYCISEKIRPAVDELRDEKIANDYIDKILGTSISIAENTDGALAIYYRINPDITTNGKTGFFYVKDEETGEFKKNEVTDLLAYDTNDIEHVGWYYTPVWAGRPVWMDPYYNDNIGKEMISYVIPIYEDSDLVGVVGMDVDFNTFKQVAEANPVYKSGGAVLCSMSNSQIYYDKCDLMGKSIQNEIYSIFQSKDSAGRIIDYSVKDGRYCLYYVTLGNRMKFMTYASRREVYAQTVHSIVTAGIIFVAVFLIMLVLSLKMGKKIVTPIRNLTEATKEFAAGNWDVKVECDTEDELQVLAENVMIMAGKTKEFINYINNLAKKDGLTGLRNKSDYMIYVDKIIREYIPDGKEYAIVVFDLNNLKYVNDNYGHEKGDELIKNASAIICKYFSHSPVFRIGGDEFTTIIDGGDYEKRNEILADFQKKMENRMYSQDIMEVCIASGIADHTEGDSYDEVFKNADKKMYENKKYLKGGIDPR